MRRKEPKLEELLPVELKIRLLESELDRLDSDVQLLDERRQEIVREIQYFEELLSKSRRRSTLRRVK